jgi:prevent-host-death family protein
MKTMAAGKFKTHCLSVIDEVYTRREEIILTKRGKPMAKLMPLPRQHDEIFGCMREMGRIVGDIVSPLDPTDLWNSEK